MAQKEFGRRQAQPVGGGAPTRAPEASSAPSPDATEALALADAPSRSAARNVMILASVGGLVLVMALGAAYGLNAAVSSGEAQSKQECRGQPNCANQYDVALTCGSSDEPKSVSVVAADAEAAERKAERYNRNCRSRRAVFVSSLIRSAAYTAYGGQRADQPSNYASRNTTATRRVWRFRRR